MSNSGSKNESEPYILIYIKPLKVGEKGLKHIVPASAIKRFDFDAYKKNKNIYKDKQLKVKLNPDGQKEKCYILYVGESHYEVSNAAMNGKRIRIPNVKFIDSVNENSSSTENNSQTTEDDNPQEVESDEEEENDENRSRLLKVSKKQRKQININKRNSIAATNKEIIDNYMNNSLDATEESEINDTLAESSPVHNDNNKNHEIRRKNSDNIYVKQLEYQLTRTQRELMNMKKVSDESHNHRNEPKNHANNTECCENIDLFKVHDKIYGFNKERQEEVLKYDDEGNVHLGCDVYCNPIAYTDSFKSKNPSRCLALLSEGVYGLNELSKRCVRKQKNTKDKKVLSPVKKMVIESKVYAFMRIKDKTISQVDDFLNNINIEHRKVINNAAVRLQYIKKQKEIEQELDRVLRDEFGDNGDNLD